MARSAKSPSLNDTLKQVKKGELRPLYLLHGEELFLADQLIDAIIQSAFGAPTDDFNLHILYAKETDMTTVLNTAMSFPIMAERKVVVLRDTELLRKEDRDALAAYCDNPMESTSLVCVAAKADFRQNPFKLLKERAVCVELNAVRDYETPSWIESFSSRRGKRMDAKAALLLASRVDVSLRELDSQVEKLATYVGSREEINEEDIETVIGVSRQYNIFELTDAIGRRDLPRAIQVFDQMFRYGEEPVGMVVMLCRHFGILFSIADLRDRRQSAKDIDEYFTTTSRLNPYILKSVYIPQADNYSTPEIEKAFAHLLEADTELKSSVMSKDLIMHRLLVRIIRGPQL